MKKSLAFIMTMLLATSLLAGCQKEPAISSSGTPSENSTVTTEPTVSDPITVVEQEREQRDLNGREFKIVTWSHILFDHVDGESDYGDAVLARIKAVEEELNCSLVFELKDPDTMITEVSASILSGDTYADVFMPILWKTSGLIAGGVTADLKTIPTLDLSKPYWDAIGNDFGNIYGKQYFAVAPMVRSYYGGMDALLFNKRILSEMQMESPYELMEKDQWTVAKLREMAKTATKDLDGIAGMSTADQWGIAGVDPVGILGLATLRAKNASFIIKNDKGALQYAMGSPAVRTSITYARDWITNDNSIFSGASANETRDVWLTGNALFYSYTLGDLLKASELEDDYGIVPFPKGESGDEYRQEIDWNRSVMCVPANITGTALDEVGYLLDSLAYHSQKEEKAQLDELKDRYTCDDESKKVIDQLAGMAKMEYSQLVASAANPTLFSATYQVYYDLMSDIGADPAAKIEEVTNQGKTALAEFMDALK